MRILMAGAAGRLGRKLTPQLEADHDLRLGDIAPIDDPRHVCLDVTDLEAVRCAMDGCDAAVHMAILDWPCCSFEEALQYGYDTIQVHVAGLHNMLQAAYERHLRQFVYISSLSAVDAVPAGHRITSDTRHYSNAIYGLTKGFGEDLCRMFHCSLGLPVAILRLGTIYNPQPDGYWLGNIFTPWSEQRDPPGTDAGLVHVDDVTRAIAAAVEAPEPGYSLVHIVGADSSEGWDLEAAREIHGWQPRYAFDEVGQPYET